MKKKFALMIFAGLVLTSMSCHCQTVMRTLSDASKLKSEQQVYIGKSLAYLLKDIKVPIRTVLANQRRDTTEAPGHFYFRFDDPERLDSIQVSGGYAVGIMVYIKEPFLFDYRSRFKSKNLAWTSEDTQRYGHLTIERLRVFTGKKED